MNERKRPAGVVPWAVAAGAVAWGLAGSRRAEHMRNYPWNVWTPIGYGAAKGVALGLLAGWCAVWFLRIGKPTKAGPARVAGLAFTGGLLAGIAPGTIRDFTGPPQPRTFYYFDEPRPDAEWYWRPLLSEWLTYTVLPALGCALAVMAAALLSARASRRDALGRGWAVLAALGVGLLLLPHYATAGLPPAEGNGDHVNESAIATMTVWGTGLVVLLSAVVLRRRMRRAPSTA